MAFRPDKRTLKKCHIFGMLKAHAKGKHLSFHTPGHKAKGWDITELSYSDNLACPQGAILRAERDAAEILGADRSFFLTDGSTAGVLSMLYAAKRLGARSVAFPENAHKSVYNGCKLLGLRPVLLSVPRWRFVTLQLPRGELTAKIGGADALLLVSPDYYGNLADLAFARRLCGESGKLLLVDGAHGGHLHFEEKVYAGTYADLWVDGVHKSLPALTQGAVVSARAPALSEALGEAVGIFRTSSPSYPVLASVEYALKFPRNERLEERAFRFAARFPGRVYTGGDWTKITALFGRRAFDAEKYLESKGIYAEFCDGDGVMFYLSPATKMRELAALERALSKMFSFPEWSDVPAEKSAPSAPSERAQTAPSPAPSGGVENAVVKYLPLSEAIGKPAARTCGLFPPCMPLVQAGERLAEESARLLSSASNVFGLGECRTFPALCGRDDRA